MADEDRILTYGDVTFEIGKMLPMEAYEVFMRHVRPLLEGAASVNADGGGLSLIAGILSKAPYDHVEAVRTALFRLVWFNSSATTQKMMLSGNEELAFKDLTGGHVAVVVGQGVSYKFSRVLGRSPIGASPSGPGYSALKSVNTNPFFWNPVEAGHCKWEAYKMRDAGGDPLIDLADVCDMNERLLVSAVNRERADAKAKRDSERKGVADGARPLPRLPFAAAGQ